MHKEYKWTTIKWKLVTRVIKIVEIKRRSSSIRGVMMQQIKEIAFYEIDLARNDNFFLSSIIFYRFAVVFAAKKGDSKSRIMCFRSWTLKAIAM